VSEYDESEQLPDDDLVRALRAPGSSAELGREREYVAAYREAVGATTAPVPLARRHARRLSTGGTALVVAVALSGGAAAYTGHLPDPVQEIAHSVIGAPQPDPVSPAADAPAPEPSQATARPQPASPGASPSTGSAPSSAPAPATSAQPTPTPSPTRGSAGVSPGQGSSATAAPGDQPSPPPPPPPAPPRAAAARITAAAHVAAYGEAVRLAGQLTTSDGAPAHDVRVALQVARGDGWQVVSRTVTDAAGRASAGSLPVTGLARYRWRAAGVHSRGWQLRVRAALSSEATVGDQQTTITATAVGASAGDRVLLYTVVRGQPKVVGRARLAADGTASFAFRTPATRRAFVVRLPKTPDHTAARSRTVVAPPPGRPSGDPAPRP
jgi:hypothetical protein